MNTGLVVIDMLNDFHDGALANPAAEGIVEPLKKLIDAARADENWIIIYGNDAHKPGDPDLGVFGEHAIAGTSGAEVIEALAPEEGDEIVNKRHFSVFTETDLDTICRIHGIERLVMVGQHTDCCVRHASYDAFVRGHELVVVSDATVVFQPLSNQPLQERQQAALLYLKTMYGAKVVSTDELLAELDKKAA
jgi:nicotinamidase-related amidase